MCKYALIAILSFALGVLLMHSCGNPVPTVNYIKEYKQDTKPYMDTIDILNNRIAILKKQKAKIIIKPYKELVASSVVSQERIDTLLDQVYKRDDRSSIDSLEKMNLEKKVLMFASSDSICVEKLELCQSDLDKTRNKGKVKNAIIGILVAVSLVAIFF
jgi:hypothetical protein